MNEFTSILNEKTCLAEIQKDFKFQVPTTSSKVPSCRARRQAVTVTAAARSAASQRGLRGPVRRHRGSQHAARSADCGEELRGASAKRWRSVAECMHGAKERSQREALAPLFGSVHALCHTPPALRAGSAELLAAISASRCMLRSTVPAHGSSQSALRGERSILDV